LDVVLPILVGVALATWSDRRSGRPEPLVPLAEGAGEWRG
jgi:hypothetical protein